MLKSLPVGVDDFTLVRTSGYLFVDKTSRIPLLLKAGSRLFLSRPRRFGKTTLVSILEKLFREGDRDFEGLEIYGNWPFKEHFNVLRLDFRGLGSSQTIAFETDLCQRIVMAVQQAGCEVPDPYADRLETVFLWLGRILSSRDWVLLLDENDYPLSCNLHDKQRFEHNRDILYRFYSFLHRFNGYFRFMFITGIGRYKETSLSTGQNFTDISMKPQFGDLLGYTEEEVSRYFAPYIEVAAQKTGLRKEALLTKLKTWYDGFCFDYDARVRVYSPWSVNNFFQAVVNDERPAFTYYWMDSANVNASLRKVLRHHPYISPETLEAEGIELSYYDLSDPVRQDTVSVIPLLAQNGYLTITATDLNEDNYRDRMFVCKLTNEEIKRAYSKVFLQYVLDLSDVEVSGVARQAGDAVRRGDVPALLKSFNTILSTVSYQVLNEVSENLYREILRLCLLIAGLDARAENLNHKGQSDLEIVTEQRLMVFEFKRLRDKVTQERVSRILTQAVRQMEEKQYGDTLLGAGREVVRVAAVISDANRHIESYRILPE